MSDSQKCVTFNFEKLTMNDKQKSFQKLKNISYGSYVTAFWFVPLEKVRKCSLRIYKNNSGVSNKFEQMR